MGARGASPPHLRCRLTAAILSAGLSGRVSGRPHRTAGHR